MADGLELNDVDNNIASKTSRVAFCTGPGRVQKSAGSVPGGAFRPPSDATLQCLKAKAAVNNFGLGNVKAFRLGGVSDPSGANLLGEILTRPKTVARPGQL